MSLSALPGRGAGRTAPSAAQVARRGLISSCEIDGRRTAGGWSVRSPIPCLRGSRREPPCGARIARCRARRRCRTCPRDMFRLRLCGPRNGGHDHGQARARGRRLRARRASRGRDAHLLHRVSRAEPLRPRGDPLLSGHRTGESRQLAHRRGCRIRLDHSRRPCAGRSCRDPSQRPVHAPGRPRRVESRAAGEVAAGSPAERRTSAGGAVRGRPQPRRRHGRALRALPRRDGGTPRDRRQAAGDLYVRPAVGHRRALARSGARSGTEAVPARQRPRSHSESAPCGVGTPGAFRAGISVRGTASGSSRRLPSPSS